MKLKIMEKLPEKYQVKCENAEQTNIVLRTVRPAYKKNSFSYWEYIAVDSRQEINGINPSIHLIAQKDYTVISFEDFKRLVLKQEEIPEYVECIKDHYYIIHYYRGKIYEVTKGGYIAGNVFYNSIKGEECFRPSTKESYEAQNKPKEPELIVGNWYEGLYNKTEKHIFHYLGKGQKDYYFHVDKQIRDNRIETSNWTGYAGLQHWTNLKPANMEEVYSYFPEERPKNLLPEVNKYITVTCPRYGEKSVMIGLVLTNKKEWDSEHLGGQATFLSTFNDQRLFNNDREWAFYKKDENRNWRLSTPDEIKWLEACIKANKFIPKEEALKTEEKWVPKVGDWITVIGNKSGNIPYLKVKTFQIKQIIEGYITGYQEFLQDGYKDWGIWLSDLRLATPEEIAKVTGKKEEPMNTYGLKVGDKLPDKVTLAWLKIKGNFAPNKKWDNTINFYGYGDRTIECFEIIENIVAFKVSGCSPNTHYLKAEGFKEFMDNFDKPVKQELTSLPEKWCIKITEENREDLNIWRTDKSISRLKEQIGKYILSFSNDKKGYCVPNLNGCLEFTEITFDQFKKWVLKEDKPKFEVGKWYKVNNCWWAKFDSLEGDIFWMKQSIDKFGNYYTSNSQFNITDVERNPTLLADLSEIQQYLPDGHVDKIVKPKSLVGRWVKVVKSSTTENYELGTYLKLSKGIDSANCYRVEESPYAIHKDEIEIMPEGFIPPNKELSKEELLEEAKRRYPIGSKVKALNNLGTNQIIISEHSHHIYKDCWSKDDQAIWFYGQLSIKNDRGVNVYANGKWAEIVSKPEEKSIYPLVPEECYKPKTDNYEVNLIIPKQKGFDEKEFLANPFNQKLEIKIKNKKQTKTKLQLI